MRKLYSNPLAFKHMTIKGFDSFFSILGVFVFDKAIV
jgi:hypothetical protein